MAFRKGFIQQKDQKREAAEPTLMVPSQPPEPVVEEAVPKDVGPLVDGREDAALLLLEFLPEEAQQLIREAQQSQNIPFWRMLLGFVMQSVDRAEVFVPYQLSAWEFGGKANAPRPCKTCGQPFVSRFPNAAHCCPNCFFDKLSDRGHSDDCPTRPLSGLESALDA